jgi:hypothetical protein
MARDRILAALDQAIAASSAVHSSGPLTGFTSPHPENWPVTAVQLPWREWTELVEAIRPLGGERDE